MHELIETECISWRWNGNLGDDMLFAAQEAMFKDAFKLGQYISDPKALIIGGGTFIPKAPENPAIPELAIKIPTAIFGTGVGEPRFWGDEYIGTWIEVIENAKFVGVRGPLSRERLISWGADKDKVKWIGDAALYFAERDSSEKHFRGNIAINAGTTYGRLYGIDESQLEEELVKLINDIYAKGWTVTLISVWQPDDAILERIRDRTPVETIEYWHDKFYMALDEVRKFDVFICEKLHASVAAACRGIPFIALNYRDKVLDFCQSIQWEAFCVEMEELHEESMRLLNVLSEDYENYRFQLQENTVVVKDRLISSVSEVISLLS